MTQTLLILGTMGEFIQLVQKAKARGIYTIVCDGYADGPARVYADESYVIPVTDIEQIASLCNEKHVDNIITSFSDLLLECMVKIAALAKIPCYLKPEQLPWYRDKSATKELLEQLGLPTPKFCKIPIDSIINNSSEEYFDKLSYPLVTKPMDKYGSRGIYIINNANEFYKLALQTAQYTDLDYIIAEEYNTSYEFNMMTWVLDGKVHVISIADREKTYISPNEIPISTRNVYPSRLYQQVEQPAKDVLQKFIEKTGQTDGALSMQFFWHPENGIQVCEIAARFFGYEHELTDYVWELNLEDLLLDSLYDQHSLKATLHNHKPGKPRICGAVLYYHGRNMKIHDLSVPQELSLHPAVKKPWIFYKNGEEIVKHGPNPYVVLYYIVAENYNELDQITDEFYSKMTIKSDNGDEVLYKNCIPVYPADNV